MTRLLLSLLLALSASQPPAQPAARSIVTVDDASRLDRTPVARVVRLSSEMTTAERQLRGALQEARERNLPVSIAGARHTMGGQTIAEGGVQIDMTPLHAMRFDPKTSTLHVEAGARWSEVIPYLDRFGASVAVMQSNNPFTVGGSIGANCHGWTPDRAPIASTVRAMRVMRADGSIVHASRTEHPELFSLVIGGYGGFGVMLDADLTTVPNQAYRLYSQVLRPEDYVAAYRRQVCGAKDVGMAYGRLSIDPDHFLEEATLTRLVVDPTVDPRRLPPFLSSPFDGVRRAVFRGSVGSNLGKKLRWAAEKRFSELAGDGVVSRNQVLNESIDVFENRASDSTDILQEYFVPVDRFTDFVEAIRRIVPPSRADLVNVTIRDVRADHDAFLRYADRDMLAFVMLFNHPRTQEADRALAPMTHRLIDAAIDLGGRYYLPYRLQATPAEFARAYPQSKRFFALKHRYDPDGIFTNRFFQLYDRE